MTIMALSESAEYHVVNKSQDCRGWPVLDQDGTDLGRVEELMIDTDRNRVYTLRLDSGAIIPVDCVDLHDGRVLIEHFNAPTLTENSFADDPTAAELFSERITQQSINVGKRTID